MSCLLGWVLWLLRVGGTGRRFDNSPRALRLRRGCTRRFRVDARLVKSLQHLQVAGDPRQPALCRPQLKVLRNFAFYRSTTCPRPISPRLRGGGSGRVSPPLRRERGQPEGVARSYDLTGIYLVGHIPIVESSFAIVAEPNRRAILSLLLSSERSVGEIERELQLSQPSVSKHLRVLREAGFVEPRVEAQRRLYRLRPEPLMELDAWLVPFRRFWSKHVDALEQHLDKMDKVPSVKKKEKT